MKTCIVNGKVILKDGVVEKKIVIEDGKIINITDERIDGGDYNVVDAAGYYVSPGFIDMHIHGRNGSDAMYANFDDLNNISCSIAKQGTTSFLPTTITQSFDNIHAAVKNMSDNKDKVMGAKIIGAHLEGPFFNVKYKGAQPEEYCINPSIDGYEKMVGEYGDNIALISLAPELEGSEEIIPYLVNKGVVVSMGHTGTTYAQAKRGAELGISHATHVYNAMTPLNHREPGAVGAAFDFDDIYAELILDGIHVSFPAARALLKCKGLDKVVLVTDCLESGGLPDGEYQLGGQKISVVKGACYLESGTLAGSTIGMNKAVYNAWKNLNIELYQAVNLASLNPANNLKRNDIGEIAIGKCADIIFFDDNLDVKKVMINGKEV